MTVLQSKTYRVGREKLYRGIAQLGAGLKSDELPVPFQRISAASLRAVQVAIPTSSYNLSVNETPGVDGVIRRPSTGTITIANNVNATKFAFAIWGH
jgi:hypothetical protein